MFTSSAAGQDAASAGRLVSNGTFSKAGEDGTPAGWTISVKGTAKVVRDDGQTFVRVGATDKARNTFAGQAITLDPTWKSLRLKVSMRVNEVTPGQPTWQTARVLLAARLPDGRVPEGGYGRVIQSRQATDGWIEGETVFTIPSGATTLDVQCGFFMSVGTADFTNVHAEVAEKHQAAAIQPGHYADAEPTALLTPQWDKTPVVAISPTRSQMILNDVWQFMPAVGPAAGAPLDTGWGFYPIPGSWRGQADATNGWTSFPRADFVVGSGPVWDNLDVRQMPRMWFKRSVSVPAEWKERRVVLDIESVSTHADVYVNGEQMGQTVQLGGVIDVTRQIRFGQPNELVILATADPRNVTAIVSMDAGDDASEGALVLASHGITGDVTLRAVPAESRIDSLLIKTSVRKNRLDVTASVHSVTGAARYRARVLDLAGEEVRTFEATLAEVREGRAELGWDWADPHLWDIDDPHQYVLQLELLDKNLKVVDALRQRFGFREFWIDGRDFFLNGKPIRLRPLSGANMSEVVTREQADNAVKALRDAGFNFYEFWPKDPFLPGHAYFVSQRLFGEAASRQGLLFSGIMPNMQQALTRANEFQASDVESQRLRTAADEIVRRLGNEPSLVMWATTPNFFAYDQDQNPRLMGRKDHGQYTDDRFNRRARAKGGESLLAVMRQSDPTRPFFTHHGGSVGDVHTLNNYLNFIPLQERIEWLEAYRSDGNMPYLAVEFGVPYRSTWHRGRNRGAGAVRSEPWLSEFGASDLGRRAYELERPEYRRLIEQNFKNGQNYDHFQDQLNNEPVFQEVTTAQIGLTWRAWRTWGITGGMIPWHLGYGWNETAQARTPVMGSSVSPGETGWRFNALVEGWRQMRNLHPLANPAYGLTAAGEALVANNNSTLAWIAGRDGDAEADRRGFTDRSRHFRSGQTLSKQLVLINDTRQPQSAKWAWRILLDGKETAAGQGEATVAVASDQLVPLDAMLPVVSRATDGQILLSAVVGTDSHQDTFAFRVYPEVSPAPGRFHVLDRFGDTTGMLKSLGYQTEPWDGRSSERPVIIGRRHLEQDAEVLSKLKAFVEAGGRAVIMSHDPDWMRAAWGFRVARHQSRTVFAVQMDHSVVAGLDAFDLSYWTGHSRLLEPRPDYINNDDWLASPVAWQKVPYAGWRWGTRHTVSSAAIEKPHHSGWRPILECQFDLAYSPLMELDYGRGRLTFCGLDFEDHVPRDPAATELARRLFDYVSTAALIPRHPTVLVGSDSDAALLNSMGLTYTRQDTLPDKGLVIIGDRTVNDTALADFVRQGGRLLILNTQAEQGALGTTLRRQESFPGSLAVPDWPEAAGLSPSDLRWRVEHPAWVIVEGAAIGADGLMARKMIGEGVVIFLQNDPRVLPADEKTYFRFTRWRQTRTLAQILANLGAQFVADEFVMNPQLNADNSVGPYHADYHDDFLLGDDPFRYFRW